MINCVLKYTHSSTVDSLKDQFNKLKTELWESLGALMYLPDFKSQ